MSEVAAITATKPAPLVLTPRVLFAASVLTSVLVVLTSLALYHHFVVARQPSGVATVALRELLEVKQLQVTLELTKPGVSDRERAAGYDEIATFATQMEAALVALQRECACTILVRDAVVKTSGADLTAELARRLGVAGLRRDDLAARLQAQGGGAGAPPAYRPEGG
jgi:hypothetical protein